LFNCSQTSGLSRRLRLLSPQSVLHAVHTVHAVSVAPLANSGQPQTQLWLAAPFPQLEAVLVAVDLDSVLRRRGVMQLNEQSLSCSHAICAVCGVVVFAALMTRGRVEEGPNWCSSETLANCNAIRPRRQTSCAGLCRTQSTVVHVVNTRRHKHSYGWPLRFLSLKLCWSQLISTAVLRQLLCITQSREINRQLCSARSQYSSATCTSSRS
jgi:hypothetical protein